jgi:hypothetical protein
VRYKSPFLGFAAFYLGETIIRYEPRLAWALLEDDTLSDFQLSVVQGDVQSDNWVFTVLRITEVTYCDKALDVKHLERAIIAWQNRIDEDSKSS